MHADRELNLHLGWPWGWGPTDRPIAHLLFTLPSTMQAEHSISRLLFKTPFCAHLLPNLPESNAEMKISQLHCMNNTSCKVVIQLGLAAMQNCKQQYHMQQKRKGHSRNLKVILFMLIGRGRASKLCKARSLPCMLSLPSCSKGKGREGPIPSVSSYRD